MKAVSFGLFAVMAVLVSCADTYTPVDTKPVGFPFSQVVFGHLASFIQDPDILYKFENNTLYSTHHLPSIDLQNFPAFYPVEASDSLKQAVRTLFTSLPSDLTSNSSHMVGNYFPDMGYTYVQVTKDTQVQYWNLQASLPPSLSSFSKTLQGILSKLP